MLEPRCAVGLGEAPFEVEIEDERHGQRGEQCRHRQRGPRLGAPLPPSAREPERREPHGEQPLRARGPIAAELPREVLHVVQELLAVEHERVAGVLRAGRIHRIVEHGRLAELLAHEHCLERGPGRRLALVQIRVEVGANRHEEVDARRHRRQERRRDEHAGPQQGPGIGRQHVDEDGGRRQEAHEMVRRGEREQVRDEHEIAVAAGRRRPIGPAHGEPQHERDREHAHRVDLLVRHRLVPHRERRRADDDARSGGEAPHPGVGYDGAQPPLPDQEPEARGGGARHCGEQVDTPRVVGAEREQSPRVRQENEERVPGGMGNAERVYGRTVF